MDIQQELVILDKLLFEEGFDEMESRLLVSMYREIAEDGEDYYDEEIWD